mmetsp:Transcript_12642/g.38702  ORF Transcript_12642/g.38702 Transcript_12642/m.38702 type:complete len:106 (-) Transcript_12642:408-725(-)
MSTRDETCAAETRNAKETAEAAVAAQDNRGEGNFWTNLFTPGVSTGTQIFLRFVLLMLNVFLLGCTVAGVNSPHSGIMFLLSMGLSVSYFWFMYELAKSEAQKQD